MMSTAVSPSPFVSDDVASHGNALSASPRHDGHASSTLESVVKNGGVKLQEQEQEQKDEATGSHLSDDTPDIWYPLSLQKRTIHVFIGIFAALLTSVEAIFIVSERCQGLTTPSSSAALHYTWTYGPTAVMSLTAVLCHVSTIHKDLHSLDPDAAYENGHRGAKRAALGLNIAIFPCRPLPGLKRYHLEYPHGVSEQFVYQTFDPTPDSTSELRVMVDGVSTELDCHATSVAGFRYKIARDIYMIRSVNATFDFGLPGCDMLNQTFSFKAELHQVPVDSSGTSTRMESVYYYMYDIDTTIRLEEDCNFHPLDSQRLLLVGADFLIVESGSTSSAESIGVDRVTNMTLQRSQQLVCKPRYTISSVDIVRDAAAKQDGISLTGTPQAMTTTPVHTWDISSHFGTMSTLSDTVESIELANIDIGHAVAMDMISIEVLGLGQPKYTDTKSLFNSTALALSLQTYYHIHTSFMVQALPSKFALAADPRTIIGSNILANRFSNGFPKGLGGSKPTELRNGVHCYPRKVATGEARGSLQSDKGTHRSHGDKVNNDTSDSGHIRKRTNHQPFSLRTWSRSSVCGIVAGVIILLEILLQESQRNNNDGIGTASNVTYLHYLWTLLPPLGSSLISIFFSSLDSELRTFVPFYAMRNGPSPAGQSVNLNLRGLLGAHTLYRQFKTRHFPAAMATVAAMIAGLLAIASTSIFFEEDRPQVSEQHLRLVGSFTSAMYSEEYYWVYDGGRVPSGMGELGIISTLMLQSNLSAPAFTYQNLAFPVLALDARFTTPQLNSSEMETHAVMPALRGGMVCRQHLRGEILADILHSTHTPKVSFRTPDSPWPVGDTSRINVTDQITTRNLSTWRPCFSGTSLPSIPITCPEPEKKPSVRWKGCLSERNAECGHLEILGKRKKTITQLQFPSTPQNPVCSTPDTVQPVLPAADSIENFGTSGDDYFYSRGVKVPGAIVDTFFAVLTTSPYGVPLSDLADPAATGTVIDTIKFQHGIVMAQALSSTAQITLNDDVNRGSKAIANDTGVFDRTGQGPATVVLGTLNATESPSKDKSTATTTNGSSGPRRRVIQDPTVTRVMQGLLGATLLCSLLSWALAQHTAVLTRPPTNIASVLALAN
ncbi:hypothetical protein B0H66DRAFT_620735 [Apodospora peruviana]|uniref:Transmembrane protein n=1 Tax=Apodospora peruviana TaxID=516989 RepID=A0AAE0IEN0_9PEZI|nr:hypothetical protein B0H66DRAFT_620735 [Apodospora peruviana]